VGFRHNEGVPNHIDPEPCVISREDDGEAPSGGIRLSNHSIGTRGLVVHGSYERSGSGAEVAEQVRGRNIGCGV
jgi:hypothetical protein